MNLSIEIKATRNKFGDFRAIELIREAGFDAVDYSFYGYSYESEFLSENYREYAKEVRRKLDEVGLVCNQAHAPFSAFLYGMPFSEEDKNFRDVVRAIESASILGAKCIVVHSIKIPDDKKNEVCVVEYNHKYYDALLPYAKKFGIKIAVETLFERDTKRMRFRSRFATPEEFNSFVGSLDPEYFTGCIDIGHVSLTYRDAEDFITRVDPRLVGALHVQDGDYRDDRHTLPFIGDFNWENIMKALKSINYSGDFTFELTKYTNKFPDELVPEALKFARKIGRHLIGIYENA